MTNWLEVTFDSGKTESVNLDQVLRIEYRYSGAAFHMENTVLSHIVEVDGLCGDVMRGLDDYIQRQIDNARKEANTQ